MLSKTDYTILAAIALVGAIGLVGLHPKDLDFPLVLTGLAGTLAGRGKNG